MNHTTAVHLSIQQQQKITTAYNAINAIEDVSDLKRNRISLSDYHALKTTFDELTRHGRTVTFIDSVAKWYKRKNFAVSLDADKVNYIITV